VLFVAKMYSQWTKSLQVFTYSLLLLLLASVSVLYIWSSNKRLSMCKQAQNFGVFFVGSECGRFSHRARTFASNRRPVHGRSLHCSVFVVVIVGGQSTPSMFYSNRAMIAGFFFV
jgi:hypothetical protein